MNKQIPSFEEVFGQLLPVAKQMQTQFQEQVQQLFSGAIPSLPVSEHTPNLLGSVGPFMTSVMSAFQHSLGKVPLNSLSQLQSEYATEFSALLSSAFSSMPNVGEETGKHVSLDEWISDDKRFASKDWRDHGIYELTAALYSLNAKYTRKVAELMPAEGREKRQIDYAIEQFVDAMSPSNFFVSNPEAQKRLLETKGESLTLAIQNLLGDLQKGRISQTDESAFEVGVNVARSEGEVVFENALFQLIQYKPLTEQVGQIPMLFVPPCINKFYILDLQPANSLVRYVVEQGHTLFLVSWKNPTQEEQALTWDDYIEHGVIKAMDVVKKIRKQPRLNVLGFCVGGTLLATALSVLANRGDDSVNSVTFLTTLLDFEDTGALGVFVDEEQVRAREEAIGNGGLMLGKDLASAFSSLRPTDLIWNYVVNNYLKGEKPTAFDLLYWNSDSTNLPGPMFCWYLRNTYLENNLCEPGKVEVCGEPVDLGLIDMPVYVLATREDHIVPWQTAYRTTQYVSGDVRFVLGASGHIAGVVNPAAKNKRSFWRNDNLPDSAQQWLVEATEVPGSWWNDWAAWLEDKKGKLVKAPAKAGNPTYKPVEQAPGRYVKARI